MKVQFMLKGSGAGAFVHQIRNAMAVGTVKTVSHINDMLVGEIDTPAGMEFVSMVYAGYTGTDLQQPVRL